MHSLSLSAEGTPSALESSRSTWETFSTERIMLLVVLAALYDS